MEAIYNIGLAILIGSILSFFTYRTKKLAGIITFVALLVILREVWQVALVVFSSNAPLALPNALFSIPTINAHLTVSIDKLSAIFLILIVGLSTVACLYSIGYMDVYEKENFARFYPMLLLFVGGMMGVVSTKDMFFFLVFWEFMTLTSYILVIFESDKPDVLRAGLKYFIMTHVGTSLLFIAIIVLYNYAGSFKYEDLKLVIGVLSKDNPVLLYIVLSLLFLGFGVKAGMYPLGTWLPDAHPAAPSGISALLSGIMIKLGIYGVIRTFIWIMPVSAHSLWWGVIIATFGVLSVVMGNLSALVQRDYKRLLAYSSIGQIGYILLAIGISVATVRTSPAIATVSFVAALYHTINHTFFKGLLFLNAGSIFYKTGKRDLQDISGLWQVLPSVLFYTLIATFAIIGVPPLSGFASKWLIYQTASFAGLQFPLFILYAILAIFFSIITALYCAKFVSSAFLGPKIPSVSEGDVSFSMRLSQAVLSIFTILLGIVPLFTLDICYSTLSNSSYAAINIPHFEMLFGELRNGVTLSFGAQDVGIFRPLYISGMFLFCLMVVFLISRLGGAPKKIVDIWYCGEKHLTEEVRYKPLFIFRYKYYLRNGSSPLKFILKFRDRKKCINHLTLTA